MVGGDVRYQLLVSAGYRRHTTHEGVWSDKKWPRSAWEASSKMRDAQGCRRRRPNQRGFGLKRSAGEFPTRRRSACALLVEVHVSGECQRALQHLEEDVINESNS
ncbi:hypothetical protein PC118_g7636 [Phytophthora cactorum]|uniref:Uncharacterized protein n=1 Tax=Phytophthora cactorum TaxID=29920 RepID=A0A8T1G9X7_9STRA|nr:hypothetical protein PC118_g7636 [Phytophthora cactorum]